MKRKMESTSGKLEDGNRRERQDRKVCVWGIMIVYIDVLWCMDSFDEGGWALGSRNPPRTVNRRLEQEEKRNTP